MKMKETIESKNLVRLLDLDDDFIIDLKYATPNNFTGEKLYASDQCYIDKNTASRLIQAKNIVKEKGYGMKVWDAYRPISAQQRFWDLIQDNDFVAYPPDMSTIKEFKNSHMNGQCVDVTLTDLSDNEVEMPCGFDDFSEKARFDCTTSTEIGRKNMLYLNKVMTSVGFTPYAGEWWHFYDHNVIPVRYSDIQF